MGLREFFKRNKSNSNYDYARPYIMILKGTINI